MYCLYHYFARNLETHTVQNTAYFKVITCVCVWAAQLQMYKLEQEVGAFLSSSSVSRPQLRFRLRLTAQYI